MRKGFLVLLLPLLLRAEVYEIAEPDLLEEIRSRKVDVMAYVDRLKERIENFRGEDLVPAKEDRVYYVDPSYCLEKDIYYRDGDKWKVLYPKGYCFNPIDYLPYVPPPMVVFNPCRKEEREWVLKEFKGKEVILVSSGCSLARVRKEFPLPVYFLTSKLKEKLS